MIEQLMATGWPVAIESSDFTYFTDHLKEKLSLVTAVANEIGLGEEMLIGEIISSIFNGKTMR
ncbi:MAG: hypothetical protein ACFC1C_02980 [Candidatus Malihini olakiniferum]